MVSTGGGGEVLVRAGAMWDETDAGAGGLSVFEAGGLVTGVFVGCGGVFVAGAARALGVAAAPSS